MRETLGWAGRRDGHTYDTRMDFGLDKFIVLIEERFGPPRNPLTSFPPHRKFAMHTNSYFYEGEPHGHPHQ